MEGEHPLSGGGVVGSCLLVQPQQFQAAFTLPGTLFFLQGYPRDCCAEQCWGHLCSIPRALQVL